MNSDIGVIGGVCIDGVVGEGVTIGAEMTGAVDGFVNFHFSL